MGSRSEPRYLLCSNDVKLPLAFNSRTVKNRNEGYGLVSRWSGWGLKLDGCRARRLVLGWSEWGLKLAGGAKLGWVKILRWSG